MLGDCCLISHAELPPGKEVLHAEKGKEKARNKATMSKECVVSL